MVCMSSCIPHFYVDMIIYPYRKLNAVNTRAQGNIRDFEVRYVFYWAFC